MMNTVALVELADKAEDSGKDVTYDYHADFDDVLLSVEIDGEVALNEDLEYDIECAKEAEELSRQDHREAHAYFYG